MAGKIEKAKHPKFARGEEHSFAEIAQLIEAAREKTLRAVNTAGHASCGLCCCKSVQYFTIAELHIVLVLSDGRSMSFLLQKLLTLVPDSVMTEEEAKKDA